MEMTYYLGCRDGGNAFTMTVNSGLTPPRHCPLRIAQFLSFFPEDVDSSAGLDSSIHPSSHPYRALQGVVLDVSYPASPLPIRKLSQRGHD